MGATSSVLGLGDLALTWDLAQGNADLSMIDGDLATDRGLETAILLSLFLDRRADVDDKPPSGDASDKRGWWADEFLPVEGDKYGSRMYLLDRAVVSRETEQLAEFYARECWQWLLDDKVIAALDVVITTAGERMDIAASVTRPSGDRITFKFQNVWDHQT